MLKSYWNKGFKQKVLLLVSSLILLVVLFIFRDLMQPFFLFIRKHIFFILLSFLVLYFGIRGFRRAPSFIGKLLKLVFVVLFFALSYFVGSRLEMYSYMQKYAIFKDLNLIEINELPLTENERIQPYNNIVTMANESLNETYDVSPPQLVRVDSMNKWTMAIQPSKKYGLQRISDNTEEVFAVSSTTPFPRFSNENRIPVTFSIGESLRFTRNTYNATVMRMNPWQFCSMEPSEVYYMKNDANEWVQVVSLIKWKGFFFPYPAYGGVMVIESGAHDFGDFIERLFIGKGTYISPEETKKYAYLQKQNTLSETVSRLQAQSMMFLGGFTDPLPWRKKTAVKIPDLPDDQNEQPFVTDFDFTGIADNANGLYHWFGMEPIGDKRTRLVFSVMVPADGSDAFYYYNHGKRKDGIAGVSAMPLKVMESKKEYDWTVNMPVEFRPYIKKIAGRKRMFMLSTVASKKTDDTKFDGAATPDLALIDAEYRDVIWVDAKHPSTWEKTVYDQLNEVWRASENIGHYYKEENVETFPNELIEVPTTVQDSLLNTMPKTE